MNKQEIREEIAKLLRPWMGDPEGSADDILNYLHSQGVMRKVKCPDCSWSQFGEEPVGMTPCFSCNSTGYVFEPLIDTVKLPQIVGRGGEANDEPLVEE